MPEYNGRQINARSRKPEQHGPRRTSTKEEQGLTHQSSANTSGSMEGWAVKGSGAAAQTCDDKARTDKMHYTRPTWCIELGWALSRAIGGMPKCNDTAQESNTKQGEIALKETQGMTHQN